MARAKREDERLLSKEEQDLVAKTRHPILKTIGQHDLLEVVKQLRARRGGRAKREGISGASCAAKQRHPARSWPQRLRHRRATGMEPNAHCFLPP